MELEKGASFSVESLLENASFRAWVLAGDEQAAQQWQYYLQTKPEAAETIEHARTLLLDLKDSYESLHRSPAAIEAALAAQLRGMGNPKKLKGAGSRRIRPVFLRSAAAAAVVLLLALGWWWQVQRQTLTYTTNFAEWRSVELPDGSQVKLNANSTLRLDRDWSEDHTRRVWLEGEAYFQVQKKPQTGARFQVTTNDLTVEVLGTAFNVHSRGEATEVFLEEGQVRLDIGTDSTGALFLQPGEKLAYSRSRRAILDSGQASAEIHLAWKDGLLRFDKAPMREVLQKIQDIYGITFQVEQEAIYNRPIYSQGIPIGQLEYTLPILAKVTNTTIRLENKVYVIE